VTTSDAFVYQKIRMLRDHGQRSKYYHEVVGMNARMDGIQGAVLTAKLQHLEDWNSARIRHACAYGEFLGRIAGVTPPVKAENNKHIYHIYGVQVPERERLQAALKDKGVSCGIHYPLPVHLQKAYAPAGLAKGSFPVSEGCAEHLLSLPMFPELTLAQIEFVADIIRQSV
jgi:dTDP-4-amino-4,6-dideoxygalactose transaminase